MNDPASKTSRRLEYQNPYQRIYRQQIELNGRLKEYYVSEAGVRAGVVVVDEGSVLLVNQYRLLIDGTSWEIPGGRVDENESPQDAAVRECLEETGVRCFELSPLLFYQVGLDTLNNPTHLFYTQSVSEQRELKEIHQAEVIGSDWVPLSRCIDMIFEGEILDSFTIIGLFSYARSVERV
jgi:8-oxo-dGTP pyrophosphatase MutT (NUDIX family)